MNNEAESTSDLLAEVRQLRQTVTDQNAHIARLEAAAKEHQHVVEALSQREMEYRALYHLVRLMCDNVPDLIWAKDMDQNYVFTNKAMCEKLLNAADTTEPVGKNDLFFAARERAAHPDNPTWHTFGEICANSDAVMMASGQPKRFDEYGYVKGAFVFLDVYKAPFRDEQGQMIGTVGCARIVTQEKLLEAERQLFEQTLAEERNLLRTVIDILPIHIYAKDTHSRFLLNNLYNTRFVGVPDPKDLLGKTDFVFFPPEMAAGFYEDDQRVIRTGEPLTNRHELSQDAAGSVRHVLTTKVPLRNSEGEVIGLVGTGRDITELKQTEQTLRQYARRLQTLHEIDQAILSARSPQTLAQAALTRIRQVIPCQRASVVEYNPDFTQATVLAITANHPTATQPGDTYVPYPPSMVVLQQGEVYRIDDLTQDQGFLSYRELLLQAGLKSYVGVPLLVQGNLIGALTLAAEGAAAFGEEQVEIAREAAASLSVAMAQAHLHEQTRRDADTKETLLREVNHRVHNNLATIISILTLEQNRTKIDCNEKYQAAMQELITRIQGLASVHRLLSKTMWAALRLSELVELVTIPILRALPPGRNISIRVSPSPVQVSPKLANTLALIINELVTNSIKYAWPHQPTGQIMVTISREDQTICLEYQDDGAGFVEKPTESESKGSGLELIQTLVNHGLRGAVESFNRNGGVTVVRFTADKHD
jgi:PAS domain S-box-containing protein